MAIHTLLRQAEHDALSSLTLNGSVIDLGGDTHAEYRDCIQGEHTYTTLNLDTKTVPDIYHDLEKPLPTPDAAYDHVLLINVLEHVYAYQELLLESVRILKPGGSVIVVVPFLFPVHPSPQDFRRFTDAALSQELNEAGLTVSRIEPLGRGVFSAMYVLLDRLMPHPIRLVGRYTLSYLALGADWLFVRLARMLGKKYNPSDYALGYLVEAKKSGDTLS